jgi:hypothetical protein
VNVSEAMKYKREIQTSCSIDTKMLDTAEDGLVLYVERNSIDASSYKMLADFAEQNQLNLRLEIGNFIISKHALPPH